jgi:2-polyprenyl-3-methyl-5-hydroxy-6-metoxy-1,4-benzoquinol methylase
MRRREPPGFGPCPLCGGPAATAFWTTDRNRAVDDSRFEYRRCETCRTLFLENVPEDLGRWYPDDYYAFPSVAQLDEIGRDETYKIEAVLPHARRGRLVEIGPGFGVFARRAALAGFEVCGLEMDGGCCEHLHNVVGVEAVQTAAPHEALQGQPPSDVIALWHALEHLPDPGALLEAAARNLRPGGIFVAALPNPAAWQFRVFGRRWPHVDAPRHLHLIPAATLIERGRAHGLEPVALTSDDSGARHWNAFGWGRGLVPPAPGYVLTRLSMPLGRAVATLARPAERRPGRGSAYTLTLRKGPQASRSSSPRRAWSASA